MICFPGEDKRINSQTHNKYLNIFELRRQVRVKCVLHGCSHGFDKVTNNIWDSNSDGLQEKKTAEGQKITNNCALLKPMKVYR